MIQKEVSRQEYISRINRVMDYVETNIQQPLPLTKLARIASFSPYHFHRIFTYFVGETPNNFVQRLRLEKGAQLIRENNNQTITEIAYQLGFGSVSLFCRAFKNHFEMTAKEYRKLGKAVFSTGEVYFNKYGYVISKNLKSSLDHTSQICNIDFSQLFMIGNKIEILNIPEMSVIYSRHTGRFNQIIKAYEKLTDWATPRGLYNPILTKTITVTHDDPSVTDIDKVRQSACITVTGNVKVDGEIGKMIIPENKYAVGHFMLNNTDFQKAWNTMCLWVSESGYQQGDGNSMEIYYNDFNLHPEKKHIVDLCIPIKPI